MEIQLKCFAGLAEKFSCSYDKSTRINLENGASVRNAMAGSGIPEQDVKIIFVNGKITHRDHPLRDGDRIAFAPATGGM